MIQQLKIETLRKFWSKDEKVKTPLRRVNYPSCEKRCLPLLREYKNTTLGLEPQGVLIF